MQVLTVHTCRDCLAKSYEAVLGDTSTGTLIDASSKNVCRTGIISIYCTVISIAMNVAYLQQTIHMKKKQRRDSTQPYSNPAFTGFRTVKNI